MPQTVTITIPDDDVPRVAAWVAATRCPDTETAIAQWLAVQVQGHDRAVAANAVLPLELASVAPTITATPVV